MSTYCNKYDKIEIEKERGILKILLVFKIGKKPHFKLICFLPNGKEQYQIAIAKQWFLDILID